MLGLDAPAQAPAALLSDLALAEPTSPGYTMAANQFCALALVAAFASPALATPCGDQVAAMDKQVMKEAREAISASTGGKYTASSREAQGITSPEGKPPVSEAPPVVSTQAGKGADMAQQAKVSVEAARTADNKGDVPGCESAIARAKQQLGAAP